MPTYAVVNGENPGPLQHPAITLVDPDGSPYSPEASIPAGTYPETATVLLKAGNLSGLADAAVARTNLSVPSLSAFDSTRGRAIIGPKVGFIGDSITVGGDSATLHGNTWAQFATSLSGGRLQYIWNGGVGGETTAQIAARIGDAVAQDIDTCFILAGTNDTQGSVNPTTAVYAGLLISMVDELRASGITPILCTLPPRTVGAAWVRDRTQELNGVIRRVAAVERLALIDFYSLLIDPATGAFQSGWNDGDGIHPNAAAHRVMGQFVIEELSDRIFPFTELMSADNGAGSAPRNLLLNPLFLDDTNADGIPNSWIGSDGSPGFYAHSIVSGDAAIKGNWAVITNTGAAAYRQIYQNVTTGFAPGDRLRLSCRVALTTDTAGITVNAACSGGVATQFRPLSGVIKSFDGQVQMAFTVPAATTNIAVLLQCLAGTGAAKFAQLGLYNESALEALGL